MSRFNARILSIFAFCLWLSTAERDFNFNDQLQITLIEPQEEPKKHLISYKSPYQKEISKCPSTESKMMLSLILKDTDWKDIIEKKKNRAVNKLSKFFAVPKEYVQLESVSAYDLFDMDKNSVRRGANQCKMDRRLGKLEFMIGCGDSLFAMGEPISNQIRTQMVDGSIDDISGLNFGMWMIWRRKVSNRVQRHRRQTEGSGEDDYDYNYDDDEETVTDLPAVTTHAHRHHHGGDSKIDLTDTSNNNNRVLIDTNTIDTNNIKHKKNEFKPLPSSTSSVDGSNDNNNNDNDNDKAYDEEIDSDDDNVEDEDEEDIVSSVSKLESVITKTIKNTEIESLTPIVDGFDPDDEIETSSAVFETIDKIEKSSVGNSVGSATENIPIITTTTTTEQIPSTIPYIARTTASTTTTSTTQEPTTVIVVELPTTTTTTSTTTTTTASTTTTPITTTMKTFEQSTPLSTLPTTITTFTKEEDVKSDSTTTVAPIVEVKENSNTKEFELESSSTSEEPSTTIVNTTPVSPMVSSTTSMSTSTTTTTTTPKPTTTTTIPTTEYIEPEPVNTPPMIKTRLPKQPVTAGKPFSLTVPLETFYDNEDGTNLRLQLFDKNNHDLKPSSWIQFNTDTREIYGLPLEDAVSRWQYLLAATDSGNETAVETLDISVQQHKGHRSVNHEISISVKLNEKFVRNIDWQIRLIRGIAETLNDNSLSNVVVREIRQNQQDPQLATFIYTNESLPKDRCPEEKLEELVKRLDPKKLTDSLLPELSVKSVTAQLIGPCQKITVPKSRPTPHATKNFPPVPRNQVDRVNATAGHLLVFKVPADTFYDPEDTTDLKLALLTSDQKEINPRHWLQFDSKNQEFYGIPKSTDHGSEEYLLVATDNGGLTASDALVVVVNHAQKRDFSVLFKVFLDIPHENFSPLMQRKFVERVAQLFGDNSPQFIQIRTINTDHDSDGMIVHFYNTTLFKAHNRCPEEEIEAARNVFFHQDSILRDRVKKVIGNEFRVTSVQIVPMGSCHSLTDTIHREYVPSKPDDNHTNKSSTTDRDDYLFTFILPAVIIFVMVLLATIIACVLHRRRMTGKMELGDEEERKSFRSKGIPVIFQDELDEKPEIGNKSPVILKHEKPPLLPPSYNSTNLDEDNDVDEYVPPPAVVMGGREARGKSPVTPSYRKPPPYVSP